MAETNDTSQGPDDVPTPEGAGGGERPVPVEPLSSGSQPGPGVSPTDSIAEEALRAAREAIAGLGDLASMAAEPQSSKQTESGAANDMDDPFARAMAEAIEQEKAEKAAAAANATPFEMPAFSPNISPAQQRAMEMLSDVNLQVKIELGRTRMLVEDVLRLGEGAVVELDKLAGDPVDVYVNDRHVAKGEVLVLNDNFCVRINEIVAPPSDGDKKTKGAA